MWNVEIIKNTNCPRFLTIVQVGYLNDAWKLSDVNISLFFADLSTMQLYWLTLGFFFIVIFNRLYMKYLDLAFVALSPNEFLSFL